ncbi:unnamed protein product [Prunus armeniaca]
MPGIDPQIICHCLHVNPAIKSVAQKRRNFTPEWVAIIEVEIDKLLAACFIEEVSYAEWLANVVLVAKKDKGMWRVCVDYTDLNKACPKDNFPLLRIDQLVDSTSGKQLLSFMDAYSSYNQIMTHEDDKAKTSFIIERDDMLVKALERADHIENLAEAFILLRKYNMKLNSSKCTFGVSSGRFLGYLVTQRGIEAHPNQIKAILNMKSPAITKEIQSLTSRATALNRFLSRSTDKFRPFFKALKKGHKDKRRRVHLPRGVRLNCQLSSHLRRAGGTTSGILRFKSSPRCRDSLSENGEAHFFACGSARKLRLYYQAHRIIVITEFPLRSILQSPDASQRLMKWAIELSQYNLLYRQKTAIKAEALADFVVEFTPTAEEEKMVTKSKEKADDTSPTDSNLPNDMWQLHVDGASNHKGAGAGVAEYEALLAGLRLAKELSIKRLVIYSDSQLITNQASGEYMAKHPRMVQYLDNVQGLLKEFPTFTIQQVPRA